MIIRRHITSNFTVIPNAAILDDRLSIGARWLLCYLLSRPQDWQVQIPDIQKKAAVGREKAYALVKELIGVGWVRKDEARQKDGKWGGVEYVVMDEPEVETSAEVPLPENPHTAEPLAENHHLTKNGKTPRIESTKLSSGDEVSEADLDAEFEEFWKLYPRRPNNPKHPAKLKYMHARRKLGVKRETIVNSLNSYAASRKGQDPSFTKMAATWLNQRCWEDAPVEEDQKPQQAQPSDKAKLVMAVFPGMPGDVVAVNEIIRTQDLNVDEVVDAAKKYALLLKQRRADGFETPPMLLDRWLKFAWREMSQYEFCRVGMENRLSVRPKRQKATA